MKKFLNDYNFEDYFESHILSRGKNYYNNNQILDIWYQNNLISAYIAGSEIYKVEIALDENEILYSSCTCPYSEDGEYMCKHIAAVLYQVADNEIPKLEGSTKSKKQSKEAVTELSKIYNEMQNELHSITDRYGFINYYNGRYFVYLIQKTANRILDFINNNNYENAFELIKHTYKFISETNMDGSNGEYQDALYFVIKSTVKLLDNPEYYEKFLNYACDTIKNNELADFSDAPLYTFILHVHDKASAEKVIKILDKIDEYLEYGFFVDKITTKITLTHDYLDKEEAINLCYKNINHYNVNDLLTKYLKEFGRKEEVIKILKDNIKNQSYRSKEVAYSNLLSFYVKNNMLEEKKKLLPEVIIETSSFDRYKELKKMCNESEWNSLKETIISKIKPNNKHLLEYIYAEEKELDKLYELLKHTPYLSDIVNFQDVLKNEYSKELSELYKPLIIEEAKIVTNRNDYFNLCFYIKEMSKLKNSEDFIFEMLKEMYPYYKSKRAFKEEIADVLSYNNQKRFAELIENKKREKALQS